MNGLAICRLGNLALEFWTILFRAEEIGMGFVIWIKEFGRRLGVLAGRGQEIERPLLVGLGAIVLALLGSLSSVWVELDAPLGPLRIIYVSAIAKFGGLFILLILISVFRLLLISSPGPSRESAQSHFAAMWYGMLGMLILFMVSTGFEFLSGLSKVTGQEIDTLEKKYGIESSADADALDRLKAIEEARSQRGVASPN